MPTPSASRSLRAPHLTCALFAALLLGGCAVGPDYSAPALQLPAKWGAAAPAVMANGEEPANRPPELARWWERLGDKTLNRLIDEAVAGNLDVATAKARVRQARATRQQAIGALAPSVTGSGSYTRADDGSNVSSTGGVTVAGPYDSFSLGANASWELDLFGENRRAAEAATYGLDAAEETLRNTLLTLIGDVATYYVEARGYQARAALARRTAASQRETAALTRTKLQVGSASAVDVANAEGQAASTEANIPELESSYQQSVHQLAILLGQPPSALNDQMKRSAPIPTPVKAVPRGVPANVLLSRPDVRLAERQYAQYTARIGQAEAARYPDVSLVGDVSTSSTKVGDLGKSSSISWSFGPSVSIPIFNAGQLKAAVDYAQAQRDEYFLAYRAAVLGALQDVENASVSLQQERIKYRSLTSSAASYRQAVSLARTLYQSGSSSFLDVLDAERSAYSADDAVLTSRVAIATDYIALNKALGGGWTGTVDDRTPAVVDTQMAPRLVSLDKTGLKPRDRENQGVDQAFAH
ncbi:NodT family efflux transporter outer membrane factor (OMF) lipoprotein [Ancylobacter sp. 3268]|uniref:efflux transporter outer membrane subunit n=1 Tax=Ancylobacter sp. 3268 TaxID=2817752 RepID=UPI00285D182A|nr:efflux transporter outer membrane subunit [Ancylobacter sp. 3268]MDR6954972.1 NodT family efflux transporter outer membrane factor (OMF) lipoprotein [Ancylobacter sp. 3268]